MKLASISLRAWYRALISPKIGVFILTVLLITVNLYTAQHTRPYTSDDTSWQAILTTWRPFYGHIAFMGTKDTFIINALPLWLFGHLFSSTRTLLFMESLTFSILNFTVFYVTVLYIMKKCNITRSYVTLLPLIWLASFGYEFARLFLNTDWRVFEPSISFVLFVLMAKVYFKEIAPFYTWRSRIILFLTSVVVGIVTFSDPYFFYFTVVPAVALFVILALFRKITPQQLAVVLFVAIVGTVADEATKVIAARIGLLMPIGPPEGLTSMHALLGNVLLAGKGMLTIYGVNHMYKPVSGLQNVASLLNLAIVIFIAYQTCKSLSGFRQVIFKKGNKEYTYPMFFSLFLGLLTVFAVVVWVLSNVVVGIEGYRYFIILPFVGALLLVLSMGLHAKATVAISYLLTFAIVVNTITALYTINQFKESTARNNIANRADYALVNAVRNYGLSKGYAGYWDGNINTYLSKGKVQFLPVACIDHETRPLYLLVDKSLYKQYSRKSFYVLDPDASMPNTCSYKQVVLQYGKPQKVIHVLDKLILVYNYDLMTRTAM